MKTRTLLALLAILVLLPAATAMVEKGAKEQKPEGEQPKELSNTRIASCLVKVTCDPAVLPLSFDTIERLLRSSGICGNATREILEIPVIDNASMPNVHLQISPLSEEPEEKRKEVEFDEEAEFEREMKVLGREKMSMPIPAGPTYASQQAPFFQLQVSLSKDVKPAAEEFMKALIDNLRKTLDAAFKDYSKRFRQQLEFADADVLNAEDDLSRLQKNLRKILGSHNLERKAILDDMTRLRKELQAAEMEHGTNDAVMQEISNRIQETKVKMRDKRVDDEVIAELQKLIHIHHERINQLANKGAPEEKSEAKQNLARARIELAERREQISQAAGGELLRSLNNQLAELTIQRTRVDRRVGHFRDQLKYAENLLGRADEYERLSLRVKVAKQTFEDALLLHSRMKRKAPLIGPSVVVFGAD
jgi:hypothetical protein